MSIISVDFLSLENQVKRLTSLAESLEEVNEKVRSTLNAVSNMELGENEDELKISYNRLVQEKEYLSVCILKLKKILELYSDCENSILSDIHILPLNMSENFGLGAMCNISGMGYVSSETGVFTGHSIINEDWLEKLIF